MIRDKLDLTFDYFLIKYIVKFYKLIYQNVPSYEVMVYKNFQIKKSQLIIFYN